LKQNIISDYSQIVAFHELDAQLQRDAVCAPIYDPIKKRYAQFKGYQSEADLGLGCGFPFAYADIQQGDVVIDLGCAAGVDSFIAGAMTGSTGKVIGVDLTPALVNRGNKIAREHDLDHVEFVVGDIEQLELEENSADAIITNGVFSLIIDLDSAFAKAYKTLKSGGTFCMADINKKCSFKADSYARIINFTGCLNGIRYQNLYLERIQNAGFVDIEFAQERQVELSEDILPAGEENGLFITTYKMKKK
jgi:SAM-dependent methyltransferase